jgi:monoterpene epsilon-lactone hydrolase
MPIANLEKFREDVSQFLRTLSATQNQLGMKYAMTKAPQIARIMPKVTVNNEKWFRGEVTDKDLWNVLSMDEMKSMAGMLRYVTDQTTILALKQRPLPKGIKVKEVDAAGVNAEWQVVPGAVEDRVLLYFHGGGFVFGSSLSHRPLTIALGQATKMRLLSVNYRLSPEARFPAALEDCTKAYQWLLEQGIQPGNIIIAGDSAGGNITLATILNLRDKGVSLPKGAVCFSPVTNYLPSAWNSLVIAKGETDPILADIGFYWWLFAYGGQESYALALNPLVSPLFGDLKGFPPVLIQATTPELLFEQCQQFTEKAKAAGVDATLQAWDGLFHDWQAFALGVLPEAQEAIDKVGAWVQNLFA